MASTTVQFLTAFDPLDKKHVEWLKKMIDLAETMGDPKAHVSMVKSINSNPLDRKSTRLNSSHIA